MKTKSIKEGVYVCPNCGGIIRATPSNYGCRLTLKTTKGKLTYVCCSKECKTNYKAERREIKRAKKRGQIV